jgi:hypothetical protein
MAQLTVNPDEEMQVSQFIFETTLQNEIWNTLSVLLVTK